MGTRRKREIEIIIAKINPSREVVIVPPLNPPEGDYGLIGVKKPPSGTVGVKNKTAID